MLAVSAVLASIPKLFPRLLKADTTTLVNNSDALLNSQPFYLWAGRGELKYNTSERSRVLRRVVGNKYVESHLSLIHI